MVCVSVSVGGPWLGRVREFCEGVALPEASVAVGVGVLEPGRGLTPRRPVASAVMGSAGAGGVNWLKPVG